MREGRQSSEVSAPLGAHRTAGTGAVCLSCLSHAGVREAGRKSQVMFACTAMCCCAMPCHIDASPPPDILR